MVWEVVFWLWLGLGVRVSGCEGGIYFCVTVPDIIMINIFDEPKEELSGTSPDHELT